MKKNKTLGVTVIELLLVIAFLSLIILVGIFAYKGQVGKGYDSRRKADLARIKIAVEEYEKDFNCYPLYLPSCSESDAGILKDYISRIPCDPQTRVDYVYYADPSSTCPRWAWLFANLENLGDPKIEELGCQNNGCGPTREYGFNYYVTTPSAPSPFRSGVAGVPLGVEGNFYGCFSGVCERIEVDPQTGYPLCQPNFSVSDCAGLCRSESGDPINECNFNGGSRSY